jgi:3-oxoadipate enol-lactonase
MPAITVDATPCYYESVRAPHARGARPIIFVHGGFGSSSTLWRETAAALPQGWCDYAIDLFSRSGRPKGGYDVSAFADRVHGLWRTLGLERAVVCGHSMGGVVSQLVALRYPEMLAGLVLVATGPNTRAHGVAERLLAQLEARGATRENLDEISRHWFETVPTDGRYERYLANAMLAPVEAMVAVQRSLIATDLEPDLPLIAAPTLVCHGALDHGRTIAHANALADGIPGARLVVFPTSGHAPFWEAAREFDAALAAFLANV